jgi:NAD(P)-dependent dehydrogenase (short-subunit alcohol dehydrogenase family)
MTTDLAGKVALVTGARRGLGAAIALALGQRGASVVLTGRRAGDCVDAVQAIEDEGGSAIERPLDVSNLSNVHDDLETIVRELGGLDVIVNNAGVIEPMALFGNLDPLAFDHAMRVNVSGPAALTIAAWPHFKTGGRIINLLSGAALRPLSGWAAYCSSKAALLMLTRSVDLEGATLGIRCFGVAPGLVDTAMQGKIRAARINEISAVPQAQLSAPAAAAGVVAWLAAGRGDEYAGTMVDVRDAELQAKLRG